MYASTAGVRRKGGEGAAFVLPFDSHQKVICFRNSNHVVMYIISPRCRFVFYQTGLGPAKAEFDREGWRENSRRGEEEGKRGQLLEKRIGNEHKEGNLMK